MSKTTSIFSNNFLSLRIPATLLTAKYSASTILLRMHGQLIYSLIKMSNSYSNTTTKETMSLVLYLKMVKFIIMFLHLRI